jgi:hypothetical protein
MKKVVITALVALVFIGCSTGELTIASCEKYENGVCINAKSEVLKECKEPLNQDGKVYCH